MNKRNIVLMLVLILALALSGCNQKQIEELQGQSATMQAEIESLTAENDAAIASAAATLEAVTAEKDGMIAGIQATLDAVTVEKDAKIAEGEDALQTLREEKDAALADAAATLEAVTAEKDAKIAEGEAALLALSGEKDTALAEAAATLEAVTTEKDAKIAEGEAALQALTDEKDAALAEAAATLEAVTAEKDAKIAEGEAALQALTAEKDASLAEAAALLAAVTEEKDAKIAEIEAELQALSIEKDAKIAESEIALQTLTEEKNAEISGLRTELQAVTEERNAFADKFDALLAIVNEPLASNVSEMVHGMVAVPGTDGIRMYEEPDEESPAAAYILNDSVLGTYGETVMDDQMTWIHVVTADGVSGWIPAHALKIQPWIRFEAEDGTEVSETPEEPENFDFLGKWYVDQYCSESECIDPIVFGIWMELTINEDNIAQIVTRDMTGFEETNYWAWMEMEGGIIVVDDAYVMAEITFEPDGRLMLHDLEDRYTFTRETPEEFVVEAPDYEVGREDYLGDWVITSWIVDHMAIPAEELGMDMSFSIGPAMLDYVSAGYPVKDVPYAFSQGRIIFTNEGFDLILTLLPNGTMYCSVYEGRNEVLEMVFSRM